MNEQNTLECLQTVCEFYYKKTEDEFYNKIAKQVKRKLKGKK